MLILFSAENYRSIAGEQTLSMVASKQCGRERDKERRAIRENKLIRERFPGLANTSYLRTAAVYGSNASGKTTLVSAIGLMRTMVNTSAANSNRKGLLYYPFKLDQGYAERPTTFFVSFVWGGIRYEYEFSYNERAIVSESLYSFPKGRPRKIFMRSAGENGPEINAPGFRAGKAVASLLNDDCLFLSFIYAHPNFAGYESVKNVGDFFERGLIVIDGGLDGFSRTARVLEGSEGTDRQRMMMRKLVSGADVGITDAEVREEGFFERAIRLRDAAGKTADQYAREAEAEAMRPPEGIGTSKRVVFTHGAGDGQHEFEAYEESLGTRRLFDLSGYIAQAYETDATLVVDGLDSSLHPLLALNIINLFQSKAAVGSHAQLVFTAHQIAFLMNDVLDRDQIWFTKKGDVGNMSLYPLSDYSPRKGESIWKGYLLGRYDAVPLIPDMFGIVPNEPGVDEEAGVEQ